MVTFEKEQKIIIISNRKVEKGEEVKFSLFLRNEYYGGKDEKPITGISSKVASHLRTALNSWFVSVYWSSFLSLYERFLQSGIPVFLALQKPAPYYPLWWLQVLQITAS